jgi:hypothetical protein
MLFNETEKKENKELLKTVLPLYLLGGIYWTGYIADTIEQLYNLIPIYGWYIIPHIFGFYGIGDYSFSIWQSVLWFLRVDDMWFFYRYLIG